MLDIATLALILVRQVTLPGPKPNQQFLKLTVISILCRREGGHNKDWPILIVDAVSQNTNGNLQHFGTKM